MSRYHLHVGETVDGAPKFQTKEAPTEQEAAVTAATLAGRGFVVWLWEHDHDSGSYRELGMFIGDRFLPTRPSDGHGQQRHRLR